MLKDLENLVKAGYEPEVLKDRNGNPVNTREIDEDLWLKCRQMGFGGSDSGPLMGACHYKTAREVIESKLDPDMKKSDFQFVLERGHAMEDVIIREYERMCDVSVIRDHRMFRSKKYPFMIADVDGLQKYAGKDGKEHTFIIEIKTTISNNAGAWGTDADPKIPEEYLWQGRHYMSVLNADGVIFVCNWDNNIAIRKIERNLELESQLVEKERYYWEEFVEKKTLPPLNGSGDAMLEYISKSLNGEDPVEDQELKGDEDCGDGENLLSLAEEYLDLNKKKSEIQKDVKEIDNRMKQCRAKIELKAKGSDAVIKGKNGDYKVFYSTINRVSLTKAALLAIQTGDPDLYGELEPHLDKSQTKVFKLKAV